jgi:putative transposase
MLTLALVLLRATLSALQTHQALALENLALRQQLALLVHDAPRVRTTRIDRLFWSVFAHTFPQWRDVLIVVQPATVIRWHRTAFRALWTWRSHPRGRPHIDPNTIALIRKMATANPRWGAPRVHGELCKLGINVSQATVSKYMPKRAPRAPRGGQSWKTFLANHVPVSMDMFTVPTATFRVLYGLVVVDHARRAVRYHATTQHPTSAWIAQQLRNAFPGDEPVPARILRDRDGAYGALVKHTLATMGIEEVLSAPRSPWQNAYVERLIGSIRRDLLDHVIVLGERHLQHLLKEYVTYYHADRTHLGLQKDTPVHRDVEPPDRGVTIVALPRVGGLHHRYTRQAA